LAVLGYAVGVAAWQWTWRGRSTAVIGPLLLEFVLLLVIAVGWWIVHTHPVSGESLALLGVASSAMGGQSVVALHSAGGDVAASSQLVPRRPFPWRRRGESSGFRSRRSLV
jgi:hypothetical protein